ncbi:hypothetical protein H9L21_03100 [Aeromicrobium senzhongii]|uniref:Type IV toxin-antitoxin system AbiEi family antitoxin domain-containing protein n=1 Tax=Aeromicrobium senzhongii TaxID=2663859 RepID=A0ABX6SUL4_9ACTN|nr:hypothetical protein [Aeromicrobium senzhongii]MTB88040.1 hypothetical protein [Aeromicrobium senzhongii]QNL94957.1 hypothetical protein H9L21_03100 [Aeromicrobium senzhongii]
MHAELRDALATNGGHLLRRDLVSMGYSDRMIRLLVHQSFLTRLRHGTYVDRQVYDALSVVERHLVHCRAVLDRLGPGVALSHHSAAALHGIEMYRPAFRHVHVTHLDGKGGRREAGVVHHEAEVPSGELTRVEGVRVVSPARSLFELASLDGTESGVVAVSSALHAGLSTKEELLDLETRFNRWPGYSHARLAIRLADGRIESVGESRSLYHLWRHGVPRPELQSTITNADGSTLARVDFEWELHRHVGEFDGMRKYSAYGDGREALIREKRREDLVRATGRGMTRWTWNELAASRVRTWAHELAASLEHSRRQFGRNAVHLPLG